MKDKRPIKVLVTSSVVGMSAVLIAWLAHKWLVFNSQFLIANSDPTQYVTGGMLNVFIILAVVFQVLIYMRMAGQNERLISASEASADTAREAFHVGEAPYFGIAQIAPEGFETPDGSEMGYAMSVKVTFVNGGKTPAWHFHSITTGIIGKSPESGTPYALETGWHDLHNTFFRTNDSHTFEYKHHMFRHSPQLQKAIDAKDSYIFIIIKIHYEDFRKKLHYKDFCLVWDAQYRNFKDYDAQKENCEQCKGG